MLSLSKKWQESTSGNMTILYVMNVRQHPEVKIYSHRHLSQSYTGASSTDEKWVEQYHFGRLLKCARQGSSAATEKFVVLHLPNDFHLACPSRWREVGNDTCTVILELTYHSKCLGYVRMRDHLHGHVCQCLQSRINRCSIVYI